MEFFPKKLYYKIREVGAIVGVEAHVLRFWETEFPALSPPKGRNGQRAYRPGDIELILEIRKLLYEDGYTIAGARRHMGMGAPASAPKKKKQPPSVGAPKPAKPSRRVNLPLFDYISDEIEAPLQEVDAIQQKPDADKNYPASEPSERLKRVQTELENILTLLDRE